MRAITYSRYTAAEGLEMTDVATPVPGDGQVLIEVHAASLNAFDWHLYRGEPTLLRLQAGLRVKQPRVVGADLAGIVTAVGPGVTRVSMGDRVVAEPGQGACAEYVVASEDVVAVLPDEVEFADAAACAMGGVTSLQALRDTSGLRAGESVLVWGASGGVGHLAVQVARALGVSRVDTVSSVRNIEMMRDIGADEAFAYNGDGVTADRAYHVILDTVLTAPASTIKRLLAPGGRSVGVGAVGGGRMLGPLGPMVARQVSAAAHRVTAKSMLAKPGAADLALIAGWIADGSVTPVIARAYPLDATPAACAELERGHVAGKLVINVR